MPWSSLQWLSKVTAHMTILWLSTYWQLFKGHHFKLYVFNGTVQNQCLKDFNIDIISVQGNTHAYIISYQKCWIVIAQNIHYWQWLTLQILWHISDNILMARALCRLNIVNFEMVVFFSADKWHISLIQCKHILRKQSATLVRSGVCTKVFLTRSRWVLIMSSWYWNYHWRAARWSMYAVWFPHLQLPLERGSPVRSFLSPQISRRFWWSLTLCLVCNKSCKQQ